MVCERVYVGTEAAYQRYQKPALKRNIAEMQSEAAEMSWRHWGGWGPWY